MGGEDEAQDLATEEAYEQMIDKIVVMLAREMTFAEVVKRLMGTLPLNQVAEIADGNIDRLPKAR